MMIQRLDKGTPSPYSGILMPPVTFRDYELAIEQKDFLESKAYDNLNICKSVNGDPMEWSLWAFVSGILIGSVTMFVIRK